MTRSFPIRVVLRYFLVYVILRTEAGIHIPLSAKLKSYGLCNPCVCPDLWDPVGTV
jgi:hypothetical protein